MKGSEVVQEWCGLQKAKNMIFWSFLLVIQNCVVIEGVYWTNVGSYKCYQNFCRTKNLYDMRVAPENLSAVNASIVLGYGNRSVISGLKNIDVNRMVFQYSPTLLLVWQDYRLKAIDHNNTDFLALQRALYQNTKVFWYPEISVLNDIDDKNTAAISKLGKHTGKKLQSSGKLEFKSRKIYYCRNLYQISRGS